MTAQVPNRRVSAVAGPERQEARGQEDPAQNSQEEQEGAGHGTGTRIILLCIYTYETVLSFQIYDFVKYLVTVTGLV